MRVDLKTYVVVSLWFGCNNACRICMLADLREKLPAIGMERYKEVLLDIVHQGHFKNLILSGAEVTTFDELGAYVRFAKSLGWFRKIQVQTNGRRLSDLRYLEHLIACGVNEFFVSIHGLEDAHDHLTRRPGAFQETMKGLSNLEEFPGVHVITNTVVTKTSLHQVPALIAALPKIVSEVHLWNFFPMESEDTGDMIVSLKDFVRVLPQIFSVACAGGRQLTLKGFPECLPVGDWGQSGFFDNRFPVTVLPDMFWEKFSQSGFGRCPYRPGCGSKECWGLSKAYVQKYGDERDLLHPVRLSPEAGHAGSGAG